MLPLAAVPIIIHLLQRQRYVQVKFAATVFLRNAIKRTRRRVLLQDLLLLILRTLAVLLIILALARPNTNALLLDVSRPPQLEVVVLDSSMSMQQFSGDITAFENATQAARELFSQLDNSRDRGALIIAGNRAQTLVAGSINNCLRATASIEKCGNARSAWLDAIQMADESITELAMSGSEVRLTIISDFQSNEWFDGSKIATALSQFSAQPIQLNYINAGNGSTANMSVSNSKLSKQVLVKGGDLSFDCQINNYTSQSQKRLLQLSLDGKIIAAQQIEVLPRGVTNFHHSFSPSIIGKRQLNVKIASDGLHADDQQSLGFEVVGELNTILCSNNSEFNNGDVTSNFFGYLNLGDEAPLRPILLGPHQLSATELSKAQLLILSDLSSLPTSKVPLVVEYVANGGGLLALIGPQSNDAAIQSLMLNLGLTEFSIGDAQKNKALISIEQATHPALKLFTDPQWQPLLTEVPHREYRMISASGPKLQQILSFASNDADKNAPALIDFTHQLGRIAVLAAVPFASYNRMPEVPGGTMALIYDLLFSLTPKPVIPGSSLVGESIELLSRAKIVTPSGKALPFSTNLALAELGAYSIDSHTVGVHAIVEESDLRSSEITNLPFGNSAVSERNVEQTAADESPWAETLLLILLGCLIAESLLSFFIDDRRKA